MRWRTSGSAYDEVGVVWLPVRVLGATVLGRSKDLTFDFVEVTRRHVPPEAESHSKVKAGEMVIVVCWEVLWEGLQAGSFPQE
jgi:hypothetical protein